MKANSPDEAAARDSRRDGPGRRAPSPPHRGRGAPVRLRVDAGSWDGGRWLAVRRVDGVPVWRALALARGPEGDRPSVRPWLRQIARTRAEYLAGMHAAGWAHADVQPTDTLITVDGRAEVIDYALACGPDPDGRLPYRGALTHTTAPEIAATIPRDSHRHTSRRSRPPTCGAWVPPCSGAGPATAPSPTTTASFA